MKPIPLLFINPLKLFFTFLDTLIFPTLLLLGGVIKPSNSDDSLLFGVLLTYVSSTIYRLKPASIRFSQTVLILLFYAHVVRLDFIYTLLALVNGFGLSFITGAFQKKRKKRWILLLPLIIYFLIAGYSHSPSAREYISHEPPSNTYYVDNDLWLKTYYLMKGTGNSYQAYHDAMVADLRMGEPFKDVWSWRLPTIFYLWNLVPWSNGLFIYFLYLALSVCVMVISYNLMETTLFSDRKPFALVAPYLLLPYLYLPLLGSKPFLLAVELWASLVFLVGIFCYIHKKQRLSFIFLLLAPLIREHMIFPVMLLGLISSLYHKKVQWQFVLIFLLFITALALHSFGVYSTLKDPLPYKAMIAPREYIDRRHVTYRMYLFNTDAYFFKH